MPPFLQKLLDQAPARRLSPSPDTFPALQLEEIPAETKPAWETSVVPSRSIETRLTPSQAPELHAIFTSLRSRREELKARVKEATLVLALAKAELAALDPSYFSMASCLVEAEGTPEPLPDAGPEEFLPGEPLPEELPTRRIIA